MYGPLLEELITNLAIQERTYEDQKAAIAAWSLYGYCSPELRAEINEAGFHTQIPPQDDFDPAEHTDPDLLPNGGRD
jgi:hypothetical protein